MDRQQSRRGTGRGGWGQTEAERRRRGWRRGALLPALVLATGLAPVGAGGVARAASGDCTTVGATTTCVYTYTGSEQTFAVPSGVTALSVTAIGGQGGGDPKGLTLGGAGGVASGMVAVTPGATLYVEVGGNGSNGGSPTGGFNGGGTGGTGGGGASDIRTVSCYIDGYDCPGDTASLDSRLLVAGGGGGAGASSDYARGGNGGAAGQPGSPGAAFSPYTGGDGGGAGTLTDGGAGGASDFCWGITGSYGYGGPNRCNSSGSGGGGGYYGGGGGASPDISGSQYAGSGGGGGGSSYVPAGGTTGVSSDPPSVTIIFDRFSGFLQPINDPAAGSTTMSVFKAGSTVPVKFQLKTASGAVVQASTLPVFSVSPLQKCADGTVDEAVSTVTADAGTTYRWDSTGQQYIYNYKTSSSFSGMCQFIQATLDDGTTHSVYVGYK